MVCPHWSIPIQDVDYLPSLQANKLDGEPTNTKEGPEKPRDLGRFIGFLLTLFLLGSRIRVLAVGTCPYLLFSPLQCLFAGVADDSVHDQLVGDASGLDSQLHHPTLHHFAHLFQ